MSQEFSEGEILKSILRKRKMTQADLAALLGMGRTKLSMALSLPVLPDDIKREVVKGLQLAADTFSDRYEHNDAAPNEIGLPALFDKMEELLSNQKLILQLLQQQH